jgi:predicted DNA-binding protein with PD1-like motif
MMYSEGRIGRVFVIRLEDDDELPECLEKFAAQHGIVTGQVVLIGAIGSGEIVVGPRKNYVMPPDPMRLPLDGVHEVAGVGILAPDKHGKPSVHIHAALGRAGRATAGCLRPGVKTWVVGEVVLYEILGVDVARLPDEATGFDLLVTGTKAK